MASQIIAENTDANQSDLESDTTQFRIRIVGVNFGVKAYCMVFGHSNNSFAENQSVENRSIENFLKSLSRPSQPLILIKVEND